MNLYDTLTGDSPADALGPHLDAGDPAFYDKALDILATVDPEAAVLLSVDPTVLDSEGLMDVEIAIIDAIDAAVRDITDNNLSFDHDPHTGQYGIFYADVEVVV